MRAVLIDSLNRQIREVVTKGHWEEANQLIGCDTFTLAIELPGGDAIMVDDEGLLKPVAGAFRVDGVPGAFAGNGVVIGTDKEGETVDAKTSLAWFEAHVHFLSYEETVAEYEKAERGYQEWKKANPKSADFVIRCGNPLELLTPAPEWKGRAK